MIGLELISKLRFMKYKEIAERIGVTPQTINSWVKGRRKIPSRRKEQLSVLLNVNKDLIDKYLKDEEIVKLRTNILKNEINNIDKEESDGILIYEDEVETRIDMEIDDIKDSKQLCLFNEVSESKNKKKNLTLNDLVTQINSLKKKVKTDQMDLSISELVNMYLRGVLDIHPEFQRLFRWSENQKSRFIESILLGIPIPPIFVAEDKKSAYDVIDGVQRLSTIFEFMGILKDEQNKKVPPSILTGTEKVPALEGKVWDHSVYKHKFAFTDDEAIENKFLYSSKFRIIRIENDSDDDVKYDIFNRLNTGASRLSNQEIRNCLAIMLNRDFYKWMRMLSRKIDFITCIPLSERNISEQADLEYVLRFLVYRYINRNEYSYSDEMDEILTRKMKYFCKSDCINYKKEEEIFCKTFELLSIALGGNSFKKYNVNSNTFKGQVLMSVFEIVAIGIANNIDEITRLQDPIEFIKTKAKSLYQDSKYLELQSKKISSQRAVTRFTVLTEFGTKYFKP